MADYALIDTYLDVVSRGLEHRADALDLRDELADHLLESTDRARATGLDPESAQRSTMDRFSDPNIVAAMLAAVPAKGIDMVHALSRSAGILALISSILWVAVIFAGSFGLASYLDPTWSTGEYFWQSIVQGLTLLVAGVALVAINVRFAGRFDSLTGVVIAASILAFLASFGFAWAFLMWGLFFASALAITIARLSGESAARGIVSVLLLALAPVLMLIGSFAGTQQAMNEASQPVTSLIERQLDLAMFIGTIVISVLLATGFAVLGFRLRAATSVISSREPAAVA